ncbi:unnamed protein product [Periconia digitata]|uniref:Uncharacterized protein n=1 Tax=Periconia digitata TaxID=1303443 RepID=A0A9W4XZ72_9PLEO|nr:unnamed protein product [Periconia digitata]
MSLHALNQSNISIRKKTIAPFPTRTFKADETTTCSQSWQRHTSVSDSKINPNLVLQYRSQSAHTFEAVNSASLSIAA